MPGYLMLANAIIEQAVKDYRNALHRLKKNPKSKGAIADAMEIEEFFHSPWYGVLTQVGPDYLIDRLRKEAAKWPQKNI